MKQLTLPADSTLRSKRFTFGVATAAFQIEGAADKRLPCIWDTFCATPGKVVDNSDGKTACDHFNLWEKDIDLIESIGVDAYRLSISWPRVMHADNTLNEEGISFYIQLLDTLKARGISTYVTLYHWDLPQHIEDNGGWRNRKTAYLFREYVDAVSKALGKRVDSYATLNEPMCSAFLGHEAGIHAPGLTSKADARKAAHHLLLGHGLAMQVLRINAPHAQNGIVLNFTPCYAASGSAEDLAATQYADDYFNHWYAQPILAGHYPNIIDDMPDDEKPPIEDNDLAVISAPIDFLGINFYTRAIYKAHPEQRFEAIAPPEPRTDIGWEIYPTSFTYLLTSLHQKYDLPPIYITENGAAMDDKLVNGEVNDVDRLAYYDAHLNAVDNAIRGGVNIIGYFAWSLMDNFEWAEGYLKRFGLVYVDYETQTRTLKASGHAYKALITQRT